MVAGHGGHHRIAPGQRVVGQEQHRLAANGHLDGAVDGALAGQFVMAHALQRLRPGQAHANAVRAGSDLPALPGQQGQCIGMKPVRARAPGDVQHHCIARPGQRGHCGRVNRLHRLHMLGRDTAHRQHCPGLHGGRTNLGQGIGRTAAQHRGQLPATAHRHIGPHTRLGRGDAQALPIVERHRGRAGQLLKRLPLGIQNVQRPLGPRHPQGRAAAAAQVQAAEHTFQNRGVNRIAHQAIGLAHGTLIQRPRGRNALPRLAQAPLVLYQGLQASI